MATGAGSEDCIGAAVIESFISLVFVSEAVLQEIPATDTAQQRIINPDLSIFFVDTHLRLKDKINVMFEWEFRKNNRMFRIENFYSKIFCVNDNIFIVNSKPDIITNIRECLKYYFSNKTTINYKFH
jgi:hypothetical protein